MLKLEPPVPIRETREYLSKFPKLSLAEKISPEFYASPAEASQAVARRIVNAIRAKNQKGELFVLGLATGSTPIPLYKELIRIHRQEGFSFKQVVTFNLDEYYPIKQNDPESYNYYMYYNLFKHIDIPKDHINIPDGQIPRPEVANFCQQYQKKIQSYGGIDLQILGIGRTGHIGFNEPPSPESSITRLVYLHRLTRKDAAASFGGMDNVPKCAITMGIDTIRKAKKIIIMGWSQSKALIVKRSIEEEKSNDVPSTFLHDHPDATFVLDKAAGDKLTRFNTPWVIRGDVEDPIVPKSHYWILKSICWLCMKIEKPVLRLTYADYQDHNLSQLINYCANGNVEDLNLYCYKEVMSKITGWPLGHRPEGLRESPKRANQSEKVLIFSPHPDNDVISMGGTMKKLIQQGHEVHVAYMTSGSNGVFDHEAMKYLHFLKDFSNQYLWKQVKSQDKGEFIEESNKLMNQAQHTFENEFQKERRTDFILGIKTFIRSSEAKIAASTLGVSAKNIYCLDLPFYHNKIKARRETGQKDLELVEKLLRQVRPTVIYAAGDLTDPNRTHRKCLEILLKLKTQDEVNAKKNPQYDPMFPDADRIFMYRGAWEEWTIPMAKIIIPLSPKDVDDKFNAIIKHQSQKDNPMFPGDDKRQFWLRVRERNRDTASQLHRFGCPDYEACECFVTLNDLLNYEEVE